MNARSVHVRSSKERTRWFRVAGSAAVLAAAGSAGYLAAGSPAQGAVASPQTVLSGKTVSLAQTAVGRILVDPRGHTLYMFAKDKSGKSACAGACAQAWPPLVSPKAPTAGTGVKAALLGRVRRGDGAMQVTYAGHPLYRYADDRAAGQLHGQRQDDLWFALTPAGAPTKKAAPDDSRTTSTQTTTTTTPTTTPNNYPSGN